MGVNKNYGLNPDYPVDKIMYSSGMKRINGIGGSHDDGYSCDEEDV
jgi:hypothetical protein